LSKSAPPILALDVDGVIIHGHPKERWDETLEADLGIKREILAQHFFKPHWPDIVVGNTPMMPTLQTVFADLDISVPVETFVDYWHSKDANIHRQVINAATSWQLRSNGRLVLATNQDPLRAKFLWEDLGLRDTFELMMASCILGARKPDPTFFQKADDLLVRKSGQKVIFIDDLESNVEGASAHGWDARHAKSCDHAVALIGAL
jgi:putative hydrolase of the HAD superfamily